MLGGKVVPEQSDFALINRTALHQSLRLVVAKSVNSVSAFGAKSSVHFLAPPLPTKPATLGFGGDP